MNVKIGKKKLFYVVIAVILVFIIFGCRSAKKTAKQYVEALLGGKASKCASLMTDEAIKNTGAATKKIFINELDDALENLRDDYKDKYGKSWKFSVEIIDSYDYELDENEYDGAKAKMVELKIIHKGSGFGSIPNSV